MAENSIKGEVFLKFIKEKKINKWIVIAVLYAAFCFAYFMPTRSTVALFAINYGLPSFLNNDVFAFFLGGIVPLAVYELISSFAFRFMHSRVGGSTDVMRYTLRFFFIPACIVIGLVKLIYLAYPLISVFGNVIISTVVFIIFFCLYLWYALKNFVDKTRYSAVLYELGGTFIVIFGVLTLLELIMGVMQ